MVSTGAIKLFPFIRAGHPFYPQMQRLQAALRAHPWHDALLERLASDERTIIHAEIKALPGPAYGWLLERFYWSCQYWDATRPLPFQALTLSYAAKTDQITWSAFPQDTYLKTMAAFFEEEHGPHKGRSEEPRIDVLRYVPLRRLTFRITGRDEAQTPIIGKFMRRSKFQEAYDRLSTVAHGVEHATATFSVAVPRGIDEARCLYFQEAKPGENLAALLEQENVDKL